MRKALRFGIRFNDAFGPVREVVALARLAEEAGFDVVWYCHDLFLRDAWVTLTAIAAATSRIKIGTCIVNPFTADPAEIAMHAATLQEYSGGRFILGIGPGEPNFLDLVGRRQERPLTGLREAVLILRRLLAGEAAPFDGTVFRGWKPGARLLGAPPATPIPIYIGGQGPRSLRLMGELGDGALPLIFPPDYLPQVLALIAEGAVAAERSLEEIDVAPCFWFSLSEERSSAEDAMRRMIASYGHYLRDDMLAPIGLRQADLAPLGARWTAGDHAGAEAMVQGRMFDLAILGTVEDVRPRLLRLAAQGVTQINVGPPLGPDPRRTIALLAERLIPELRHAARR
ncbi:MAG TPA: LLM class flavin-dependent oxidoreductase [Chloroflexota bacterium]|nr:LLM class flavin-dependent oxidoreductase [Chloroflexota bacterium]